MHHDHVVLYGTEAAALQTPAPPVIAPRPQALAPLLAWDGRLWLMETVGETVTLQPDIGQMLTLPAARVQHLLQRGAMRMVPAAAPSPEQAIRRAAQRESGAAAANHRLSVPSPSRRGRGTAAARTHRWHTAITP
jgi:hypothetical protein